MPVKPPFDPEHLYFITTNAYRHAHLFRRDVIKRILVDSLHFMRTSGWLNLYAFVIMPNHIHLIVKFLAEHVLSDMMRDFEKFTSKQIARQFLVEEDKKLIALLAKGGQG
jgi:putative transposase